MWLSFSIVRYCSTFATFLAFNQEAANELGGDDLCRAGEEALGKELGERGGYVIGLGDDWRLLGWWETHLQQGRLCDLKKKLFEGLPLRIHRHNDKSSDGVFYLV